MALVWHCDVSFHMILCAFSHEALCLVYCALVPFKDCHTLAGLCLQGRTLAVGWLVYMQGESQLQNDHELFGVSSNMAHMLRSIMPTALH